MPAFAALRRALVAVPVLLTLVLAVSTVVAPTAEASATLRAEKIHHAVHVAHNQVGDPYRYGADGPNAFDCSGLTFFSFEKAGLRLPRTAAAQYRHVRHIHKRSLRRGDLVFFHNSSGSVYHVGIYLGHWDGSRWILHAPYPGTRVHRERIWTGAWYAGTLRLR
jgi:cell wall-associated NlpC family hydrolase